MEETLLERIDDEERKRYLDFKTAEAEKRFKEYAELIMEVGSYDLISSRDEPVEVLSEVNEKVWSEADRLRNIGELLEMAEGIDCPVTAVHGEYDHPPYQGIKEPLSEILEDFEFVLLDRCGHYPWLEKKARDEFFRVIREEI